MRVFIVTPRLCSGGAERVGVSWANGFVERGHEVTVVADLNTEISYKLNDKVAILPLTPKIHNPYWKWGKALFILRHYLKVYRPDVIIGVMSTCSLISKIASLGLKIPVVATEHDAFERPEAGRLTFTERILKFYVNRWYDKVTILTTPDKKFIGERLKNTIVVPNPLALTPTGCVSLKEKVILSVGRLDDWRYKGFDILIEAWGLIAHKFTDWHLEIAGNGNENNMSYLRRLCEDSNISDRVHFLGFRKDIDQLFKHSSIFVLSSRYEGFGLVLIEAMSQGCACIACDYKGRQKEIFGSEDNGVICGLENPRELAEKMASLISNDERRQQLQINAIERSKYYMPDRIMEQWESILKEVTNKHA